MPSLKDVCGIAGVSVSTASHILSGRETRYSTDTRKAVYQAAEKIGYRPNLLARGLRRGTTNTIGLIVPEFYAEVTNLERLSLLKGYRLQMGAHHTQFASMREMVENLMRSNVDGLLVFAPDISDLQLLKMLEEKTAVVVDFRRHESIDCFVEDIHGAMQIAVRHLSERGHRRIGYVGNVTHREPYGYRERFFRESMAECGLGVREEWLINLQGEMENPWEMGEKAILEVKEKWFRENRPSALVTSNSEVAVGVVSALMRLNIHIPKDMSIIGLMDQSIGRYAAVPVTGVDTHYRQIAIDAMQHLLACLTSQQDRPTERICKVYQSQLVERASCGSLLRD